MEELYLVLCTNDKTDEQHAFVALRRSYAESIKASFLHFVENMSDWSVTIIRSDDE